jgi:hypothetical protein
LPFASLRNARANNSWLNAVEGCFARLTKKRLKRGVFRSLQELKDAIHRFLDDTNANPKPFTWTKDRVASPRLTLKQWDQHLSGVLGPPLDAEGEERKGHGSTN